MGMRSDGTAPLVLALDASTYVGSAALLRGGTLVAERLVAMRGADEERLMPAVAEVLAEAGAPVRALAAVVCGGGPGSFTSLRIAGAIAKGLAMAAGCPLLAVPSLALVPAGRPAVGAVGDPSALAPGRWLVTMDAMRGDRYAAVVTIGAPETDAARDGADDALAGTLPPLVGYEYLGVLGATDVAARATAGDVLGVLDAGDRPPRAAGAAGVRLAVAGTRDASADAGALVAGAVDLALWEPDYGRKAEAQVKWEAQHGRALPVDAAGAVVEAAASIGAASAGTVRRA